MLWNLMFAKLLKSPMFLGLMLMAVQASDINVCDNVANNIFLQDISNCSQYIACMNGQPGVRQCKDGLFFDVAEQACTASRSGCFQCSRGDLTMLPLAKTCNKYVQCFDGELSVQQCNNDLQFNAKIGKCDLKGNVDCVANYCSIYSSSSNLTYVPSAVSCENYYVCMGSQPRALSCAPGLYFSSKCNCCDTAENVSCSIKKPVVLEPSADKEHKNKHSHGKEHKEVAEKPVNNFYHPMVVSESVNINCPNRGIFIFPHSQRNQYYLCLDGKGSLLACPDGRFFDRKLKACRDLESESKYGWSLIQILKKKNIYVLTALAVKFYILTVTILLILGSSKASTDVNICSGAADNLFLPVLQNCSAYYVCIDETAVLRVCREGYLFDSRTQSCTYPEDAQCLQNCTSALSSFCYDRTCTKYVLCYAGTPVLRECCDGLQYNAETDRCDFSQYVDCVDNMCTIFNDPTNITFLGSRATCDKYYVCMDGFAFARNCSSGLQFNPSCNCCDLPSRANCTITALSRNITPFSRAPPRSADIECPTTGAHFYPHAQEDKYYFCMKGRGVIMDCTPGLVYDPTLETCREKKNIITLATLN